MRAERARERSRARSFPSLSFAGSLPETDPSTVTARPTNAVRLVRVALAFWVVPLLVGLTASVSEDARRSCLEAGMQFVLAKPIDVEQLVRVAERRPTAASTNVAHDSVAAG